MPKKRLEYDEHLTLGIGVRQARNLIHGTTLKIASNLPKNSRARRLALDAQDAFDALRAELDDTVARDFPDKEIRGIYYGNNEQAYQEKNHATT